MAATLHNLRPTSEIVSETNNRSIMGAAVNVTEDLRPHPPDDPKSDADSFYAVSDLKGMGHKFTVLFHLMLVNRPSPPGPISMLTMSVLDETASASPYFSQEIIDLGQMKTTVGRTGLDIRMFGGDYSDTLGYLSGTMDSLKVAGHADNGGKRLDIKLNMKAFGPPLLYNATGVIPFGNVHSYQYAFPCMKTTGVLTYNGNVYQVDGTSWFDRQWGPFVPVTWTWMSIKLDNGIWMGIWDQRPFPKKLDSRVGGQAFATILDTSNALVVTPVAIKEESAWLSPISKITFASRWIMTIPARGILNVRAVRDGQEIISACEIPRIEAKCLVDGQYEGAKVVSLDAFVEAGDILPPPAA